MNRTVRWLARRAAAGLFSAVALTLPRTADAFCGFYVSGADAKLFNNASVAVMMREGTRTVLSLQNHYQGPPEAFAMVVPVPVVLQEENVKTLPREIFDRVDQLSAPRLVEYWEQDPCGEARRRKEERSASPSAPSPAAAKGVSDSAAVKIEAQFTVGEYDVVILSANDSLALDTWLRQNKYNIPDGAEEVLRPYVQNGLKFFVAKVDPTKVTFKDGMATLSPLRFHYDDDKFALPVRLGLLNASGKQDLIVHILARGKRYEVSNYKNVTIPTNIDLDESAKAEFGGFYAALFDRTLEENPGAVITEYAWDANTCDPCPSPALDTGELLTLGADVLTDTEEEGGDTVTIQNVSGGVISDAQAVVGALKPDFDKCMGQGTKDMSATLLMSLEIGRSGEVLSTKSNPIGDVPPPLVSCLERRVAAAKFTPPDPSAVLDARVRVSLQLGAMPLAMRFRGGFVLTRLHARYDKSSLGEDLVFREASPIVGGREVRAGDKLETGSQSGSINNFQGRYAIRHPWKGKIECVDPVRGVWGGPPEGGAPKPEPALDLAFAPRGKVKLASFLAQDVPEIGVTAAKQEPPEKAAEPPKPTATATEPPAEVDEGCGACRVGAPRGEGSAFAWSALLGALAIWRRRRGSSRPGW
jgi:hypothetical protein